MMPSDPTRMRMSAWLTRSALTTGPIVVRLACASMGPSWSSSAVTMSARTPSVGSSVSPPGAADGDAPGEADAPGDAEASGDAAGEADAPAEAPAEAEAAGEPDGAALPLGAGEADGSG